jgi:tyrosyl-tRNA synthetase
LGGSDQWGNIVTGTELIRRKAGGEAFSITTPLVTKADGGKFGKTEQGTVWLDPDKTSPYQFYQFWLNVSDEDASRYLRLFTLLEKATIEACEQEHAASPHTRIMQKALAREVTIMVHSSTDYENALEASGILFGSGTRESLSSLSERDFLSLFEGVPHYELDKSALEKGIPVMELLVDMSGILPSKGDARKLITGGGLSLNKVKITQETSIIDKSHLINGKYLMVQKGKKNYHLFFCK